MSDISNGRTLGIILALRFVQKQPTGHRRCDRQRRPPGVAGSVRGPRGGMISGATVPIFMRPTSRRNGAIR
jgi:hypothetical protein